MHHEEEWVSALESLVTDEKARKAMGEAAHQKVMEHYLTENTGKDAMEELLCSESYTRVERDRFDLKDSSLYHLQGTWPKDHKPEAVLDGEKLPAAIQVQTMSAPWSALKIWIW